MSNFHYPLPLYILIFTVSFWGWIIFELWVFFRDRKIEKSDLRSQDRGSRLWGIIVFVFGIGLAINLPGIAPRLNIQNYFIIFFFLGIAFIWAGMAFRYWAIQTLGQFFRTRVIIQEEHQLVTAGPYSYLRHPSYTGALITLIGFGLGIGNWLSVIILLAAGLLAYARRIVVEEQALRARFGKIYEDYSKRTWALIPLIW